jgi:hypothetical protein
MECLEQNYAALVLCTTLLRCALLATYTEYRTAQYGSLTMHYREVQHRTLCNSTYAATPRAVDKIGSRPPSAHYTIIPYHTIPYHTIPYHTIPYHTIPNCTTTQPHQPLHHPTHHATSPAHYTTLHSTTTPHHTITPPHHTTLLQTRSCRDESLSDSDSADRVPQWYIRFLTESVSVSSSLSSSSWIQPSHLPLCRLLLLSPSFSLLSFSTFSFSFFMCSFFIF